MKEKINLPAQPITPEQEAAFQKNRNSGIYEEGFRRFSDSKKAEKKELGRKIQRGTGSVILAGAVMMGGAGCSSSHHEYASNSVKNKIEQKEIVKIDWKDFNEEQDTNGAEVIRKWLSENLPKNSIKEIKVSGLDSGPDPIDEGRDMGKATVEIIYKNDTHSILHGSSETEPLDFLDKKAYNLTGADMNNELVKASLPTAAVINALEQLKDGDVKIARPNKLENLQPEEDPNKQSKDGQWSNESKNLSKSF